MSKTITRKSKNMKSEDLVVCNQYPLRMGLISDLHVGSDFAVMPLDRIDRRKGKEAVAHVQEELHKAWIKLAEIYNTYKVQDLWILGDIVQGVKNNKNISLSELTDQVDAVKDLIVEMKQICPSIRKVYVLRGTGYHESIDMEIGSTFKDGLQAVGIKTDYIDSSAYVNIKINGYTKKVWITHPSLGGPSRPETALGKDMASWLQMVGQNKLPKVDVIIRADKHSFIHLEEYEMHAIRCPCWQLFNVYESALKNYPLYQPDIGGILMMFDDKARVRVWSFINKQIDLDIAKLRAESKIVTINNNDESEKKLGSPMPKEMVEKLSKRE